MRKLINKYENDPTMKNAQALMAYLDKHPMASVMASSDEQAMIGFAIDQTTGA